MSDFENRRILIVDDNQSIHDDFTKLLRPREGAERSSELDALAGDLFGDAPAADAPPSSAAAYELTHALQGREGLEQVEQAVEQRRPFALAFVDVRMPPGWDGITTTERMFEADPELVVVLCTAFSDYSWTEIVQRLGHPERYLILKKPFDGIEVQQLASTLTTKWRLQRENRAQVEEIRAYASSLETVNTSLAADKRLAESRAREQARFLSGAGRTFGRAAGRLRDGLDQTCTASEDAHRTNSLDEARRLGHDLAAGLLELAELSSIQAGDHADERAEVDTASLLREFHQRASDHASAYRLPVHVGDDAQLPERVELDRRRVVVALDGLVAWALGRADQRGIHLDCRAHRSATLGTLELEFELRFQGTPIGAEEREELFRPFQSPEEGPAATDSVRQLALPLVRQLSERLGGSFRLEPGRDGECRLRLRMDPGPVNADALIRVPWGSTQGRSSAA